MRKVIGLLVIFFVLTGCENSMKENLMGRWEVADCTFEDPNEEFPGVGTMYYKLNVGSVAFFGENKLKFNEEAKNFVPYVFNDTDSTICLLEDTIKVLKLSPDELITEEKDETGTLVIYYKRR